VLPIWAFLAVTIPLVLTPGASTAVVLRNSLSGGVRAGLATAAGTNTGSVCFGLLSAFGFAVVLRQWPSVWVVLRIAGFTYLGWLGIKCFLRIKTPSIASSHTSRSPETSLTPGRAFREGFVTNTSNPALSTFYFIVLPGFLPQTGSVVRGTLTLCAVHVAVAITWHSVWAIAGGTLAPVLSSGRPRTILEFGSGVALIYLAVRMLT